MKGLAFPPRLLVIMTGAEECKGANRSNVSLFALTQIYPGKFVSSDNGVRVISSVTKIGLSIKRSQRWRDDVVRVK